MGNASPNLTSKFPMNNDVQNLWVSKPLAQEIEGLLVSARALSKTRCESRQFPFTGCFSYSSLKVSRDVKGITNQMSYVRINFTCVIFRAIFSNIHTTVYDLCVFKRKNIRRKEPQESYFKFITSIFLLYLYFFLRFLAFSV
jgi:hypothetical protein